MLSCVECNHSKEICHCEDFWRVEEKCFLHWTVRSYATKEEKKIRTFFTCNWYKPMAIEISTWIYIRIVQIHQFCGICFCLDMCFCFILPLHESFNLCLCFCHCHFWLSMIRYARLHWVKILISSCVQFQCKMCFRFETVSFVLLFWFNFYFFLPVRPCL